MKSLYRYFNKPGELLYVGISINPIFRLGQHKQNASWFDSIDRIEIEKFETMELALDAERLAIQNEKPLHNIQNQGGSELKKYIQYQPDQPSDQCKSAGLKGLAELSRITKVSVQTLINWSKDKPILFSVVIKGAYATKNR